MFPALCLYFWAWIIPWTCSTSKASHDMCCTWHTSIDTNCHSCTTQMQKKHEVVFSQCLIPHEHHNQLVFSVPNLLQGPRWRPPAAICRYKHQNHLQGMHMSWWLGWVKHVKHFAAANHKVQPAFHLQCKPNHSHIPNCWCPIALLAPTSILHKSI